MPSHPAGTIENGQYRSFNQMQANHLMPSYIQILFAPRKPIPFIQPVKKPHKYQFIPYHDGKTDYARIKENLEKRKQERLQNENYLQESELKKEYYIKKKGVSWTDKETRWKNKMQNHIKEKQDEYIQWKKTLQNPDFENVTSDPYKTLIVYKLVINLIIIINSHLIQLKKHLKKSSSFMVILKQSKLSEI